jgi:hypothetical protein
MTVNDFYVYAYVDPSDESIFYIGKGKGERSQSHIKAYENKKNISEEEVILSEKNEKIDAIVKKGKEPRIVILAKDLGEQEAYMVESAFIWMHKYLKGAEALANIQAGHKHEHFRPLKLEYSLMADVPRFDVYSIYRFNVSNVGHLSWEIAKGKLPYITAGGNTSSYSAITKLVQNDIVCAYVSGKGYVGIGKVLEVAKPLHNDDALKQEILSNSEYYPYFKESIKAPEKEKWCYGAKIDWLWVSDQPIKIKSPNAGQRTSTEMIGEKWKPVLEKLEEHLQAKDTSLTFKTLINLEPQKV